MTYKESEIIELLGVVIDITVRMSQELRDLCDAAEESGSPLPATEELLEEWNDMYRTAAKFE